MKLFNEENRKDYLLIKTFYVVVVITCIAKFLTPLIVFLYYYYTEDRVVMELPFLGRYLL